jgi:hypothetical protein
LLNLLQQRGWIDHSDDLPRLASELSDNPDETDPSRLLVDLIARTSSGPSCMVSTIEA